MCDELAAVPDVPAFSFVDVLEVEESSFSSPLSLNEKKKKKSKAMRLAKLKLTVFTELRSQNRDHRTVVLIL